MADVNCTAFTCVNNLNGLCTARNIKVLGHNAIESIGTECKTFAPQEFLNAVKNSTNLNIGGAVSQLIRGEDEIVMTPNVNCAAVHCVYNDDGICGARAIAVSGRNAASSENTECETFRKG